uniref:Ribosome biogenesis regulatory protein n=1 Tax=Sphaeramia orbicularis TaxID=375764 RepID=A0A672Y7Q5_9TELE
MAACSVEQLLAKAEAEEAEKLNSITVKKELDLEFDIGNLLAFDKNRVEVAVFRQQKKDEFLLALARDNTQLLINEIWKQPTERVEEAIVAKLPDPVTPLPREKPPPKAKPPTKWEQFAKLKGIQKKKKTNLVWDETRVAKNEFNRLKNIARAQKGKAPGLGLTPKAQQSKDELARAVSVAKSSTASVGRFQDRLPKEKPPKNTGKKRKFEPLIGNFSNEKQKQLELLQVMDSKKPKMDITKAVNKQMREEDREEAAAKYKKGAGKRGRKGNMPGKGKGKGGKGKGGKGRAGGGGGKGRAGGGGGGGKKRSKPGKK